MILRIGKVKDNFLKQTFEVPIKKFCRKWEEETLPKRF